MHMGTDDNGYELALCHQQAKRQNSVPAPVFQPIHPQFWGYLCLDFEDTYADPRPCYSAPPFFREAGERTVNRRVYRKIFDRFDLSQRFVPVTTISIFAAAHLEQTSRSRQSRTGCQGRADPRVDRGCHQSHWTSGMKV